MQRMVPFGRYSPTGMAIVRVSRCGRRWVADVFARERAGPRHVAQVRGSWSCVQRVAESAPLLLKQPDGVRLLFAFLEECRCRRIG